MKATAKSPANIAFVKYWGKADPALRLPVNSSVSMCLSDLFTLCTVKFSPKYKKDEIESLSEKLARPEIARAKAALRRIRDLARKEFYPKRHAAASDLGRKWRERPFDLKAKLVTKSNFPKGGGIASSASAFGAITLACVSALGLKLTLKQLSRLARLFSGSACRSILDGFVEWKKGNDKTSYAVQIFPPNYWDISDVVAIVTQKMKKVKSTQGHALASTSPFYQARLKSVEEKVKKIKKVIEKKDFTTFGRIIEQEALELHAICLTSKPPIIYWEPKTLEIMKKVQAWRENGLETYFTIDAGPSVHLICQGKDEKKVVRRLRGLRGIERISVNKPGIGARVIKKHLF